MTDYFAGVDKIRYAGPQSTEPLAFKWYDKDRIVLG
jgi:xylose isomerase